MHMWRGRSSWVLPALAAILTSALGVSTNLATDLKSNWVAWIVVVLLAASITAVTASSERRRISAQSAGGVAGESRGDVGYGSYVLGLQVRERRIIIRPDGQEELVTDIFNEELARKRLEMNDGSFGGRELEMGRSIQHGNVQDPDNLGPVASRRGASSGVCPRLRRCLEKLRMIIKPKEPR